MRQVLTETGSVCRRCVRAALVCLAFLCLLIQAAAAASGTGEYYAAGGQIAAVSPPLDEKSVSRAANRFAYLYDTYLAPNRMNAYIAVIPDKSYYLPDEKGRGQMDYAALFELVYLSMDYAAPIDLTECMSADSYYATDSHWRQECLLPVAEHIAGAMQDGTAPAAPAPSDIRYETKIATEHFTGSYADAAASTGFWEKRAFSSIGPDTIRYLTNKVLEQAVAYRYDTGATAGLYDWDKLSGRNPYDFFCRDPWHSYGWKIHPPKQTGGLSCSGIPTAALYCRCCSPTIRKFWSLIFVTS